MIGGPISPPVNHRGGGLSETATASAHFVYQRICTLAGKPLHLTAHLRLAARAFEHIYGGDRPVLDEKTIAAQIAESLRTGRSSSRGSATVMLFLSPDSDGDPVVSTEFERTLIEPAPSHSPLRPRAVTYEYSIPYSAFPTGFQLSAKALFDTLALSRHGATRSIRRDGDRLLSCGDAPLFAIRGKTLFTTPLTGGAMESVERELVIEAVRNQGSRTTASGHRNPLRPPFRLDFREEPILHPELKTFDELFFADASGLTSLSECDGAKFMSLAAPWLAETMRQG